MSDKLPSSPPRDDRAGKPKPLLDYSILAGEEGASTQSSPPQNQQASGSDDSANIPPPKSGTGSGAEPSSDTTGSSDSVGLEFEKIVNPNDHALYWYKAPVTHPQGGPQGLRSTQSTTKVCLMRQSDIPTLQRMGDMVVRVLENLPGQSYWFTSNDWDDEGGYQDITENGAPRGCLNIKRYRIPKEKLQKMVDEMKKNDKTRDDDDEGDEGDEEVRTRE